MKKIISVLLLLAVMSMVVTAAKPVTKTEYVEYFDLDGDGIAEEVTVVEETIKQNKKSTTVSRSFFTEGYDIYLGMELIVNGEVFVDTFNFND